MVGYALRCSDGQDLIQIEGLKIGGGELMITSVRKKQFGIFRSLR